MSKPVFSDLFRFAGRRNRKSYALYVLSYAVIMAVLGAVVGASAFGYGEHRLDMTATTAVWAVGGLILQAMVVSGWAVQAQRCRDFGWTGWAILITLIPVIGTIFSLAMLFIPGTLGPNRFGPDPIPNHVNDWPKD